MENIELERKERAVHKLFFKCAFAHMQGIDIHPGQMQFMMVLLKRGRCTQTEIAKRLDVSNASVGISVRRLMKAGFVKKSADQNDLRVTHIELTEKGEKFAKEAKARAQDMMDVKFEGLSREQLEAYYDVLTVIEKNMQNYYADLKGHDA